MAERDDALARFNAAMAAWGYAPPALRLELQQRIAELEAEVARLKEYGLMALDMGQLDCQCEDEDDGMRSMCGMCLLRAALAGGGGVMSDPWCEWHWPSTESKTGQFCTERIAEGFVPDCPYNSIEEMGADKDYHCDYQPREEVAADPRDAEIRRLRDALGGLLQATVDVAGFSGDMPAQISTTAGAMRRARAALTGEGE